LLDKNFDVKISVVDDVCLVEFSGYLSHGLTEKALPLVEQKISEGYKDFVFDMATATILESPAVACILTLTEKIVDDQDGNLVFSSLSDMHVKILEMVGVFLYASSCNDKETAILECKA
jgi:hypothetical protein